MEICWKQCCQTCVNLVKIKNEKNYFDVEGMNSSKNHQNGSGRVELAPPARQWIIELVGQQHTAGLGPMGIHLHCCVLLFGRGEAHTSLEA